MQESLVRIVLAVALTGNGAHAQVTLRASVTESGQQGDLGADSGRVSVRGRYVAFASSSTNLVAGDTNDRSDIFVRDLWGEYIVRASVGNGWEQANDSCAEPCLSTNGRFVAFTSSANTLVPGDGDTWFDVFVRDLQLQTIEIVSVDDAKNHGNDASSTPSISGNGRFVAFRSHADNLVPGDTNDNGDIFVRDRAAGTTTRVSVSSSGEEADQSSSGPSISADGRYVAFEGSSSNLAAPGSNFIDKVFLHDRASGTTQLVSVDQTNQAANGHSKNPTISADGRFVAFNSEASDLVPGDTNGVADVFVRDLQAGITVRVSLDSSRIQADSPSFGPSLSGDGRYVTFWSEASGLCPDDTNGSWDVFLHDRTSGTTERLSVSTSGTEGNAPSRFASLSSDGRYVAFHSESTNLLPDDTNSQPDIFVRDRDATGYTALCEPGTGTVVPCPCSNPPTNPGRGCDNSAGTGGAVLSASGVAYVSFDSLVLTTQGERPNALSILLCGDTFAPSGIVFGQGIRCAAGVLRRLYTRSASGGSISVPDIAGGDPTISARSAQLGDLLQGGATRIYVAYYRDPIVLGGCAATSTFNATNSGFVRWSP